MIKFNKKVISYIGTIEDPEITELKKSITKYMYQVDHETTKFSYLDEKYKMQLREETWEKVDNYTYRIQQMKFVKDNIQEGESIYIIWE